MRLCTVYYRTSFGIAPFPNARVDFFGLYGGKLQETRGVAIDCVARAT